MNRITSNIDISSAEFDANRTAYLEQVDTLKERMQWAIDGGERRERSGRSPPGGRGASVYGGSGLWGAQT